MEKDVEKLKKIFLKEIRNPEIYKKKIIRYVEDNLDDAFNVCCRKNLSINEKYPDSKYDGQLGQKTVFLTVRMFDLWENSIVDVFSEHFKKSFPEIKIIPINDPVGDMGVVFPNGEIMRWEIKSSQAKDSFTGATHSSSKCENYLLINYAMNRNLKLRERENKGFITELAIFVWDGMEAKWMGEPSKHSSYTSLKIPREATKRGEIIVIGKLEPKVKWCGILREPIAEY